MDLNNLMQMAGQLKAQLEQAQNKAAQEKFTGEAGGGLVRVVVNGRHELLEVELDPKVIDPNEKALLEDLLRAAVNQANTKVVGALQQQMGGLAQGMGVDLSALGFGPGKGGGEGG